MRLASIADLRVISRTSTHYYQSKPKNLGRDCEATWLSSHFGRQRAEEWSTQVRVNVQLIKAANDSHLWADTFDRKLIDVFAVESEVAKAVADQLRAKLTGQEEQVIGCQADGQS